VAADDWPGDPTSAAEPEELFDDPQPTSAHASTSPHDTFRTSRDIRPPSPERADHPATITPVSA
jgi:hypothetical protein